MKNLLLSAMVMMASIATFAQKEGDKITINTSDGKQTEWNLAGENNTISSMKHSADGNLDIYVKGLEDFGAWETYDVSKINNIAFSVYHESDVSDVTLADASATQATKRLYKYLQLNYGAKTLSSVVANVSWNHTEADKIYKATGKYPAINCYDFIQIYVPDNNGWIDYSNLTPVTEWADAGGLVSLMWHFMVPKTESTTIGTDGSGCTCTPSETTFRASNVFTSGSWENKWFYQEMDKVVDVLLKLQDAGISATWRPFHEAAGNAELKSGASWGTSWFWWGYDGADTFKKLWQTMFNYFQSKGVHNLIWVWTTQNYNGDATTYKNDADWYPGDAYVDIIGRDLYGYTAAQQAQEFKEIQARYPGKMVTLAECGVSDGTETADVQTAWEAGAKWSYFMPWYGTSMPSNDWWKTVMSSKNVITRDQVNLNATYVEESAKDACVNMGMGTSFGNCMESVDISKNMTDNTVEEFETCWGQPVTTKAMVDYLKKNGFNSMRIPVTWFQHMDTDGNVQKEWMDRVQEIVDYAMDNDMYCIINVHHDTGADPDDKSYSHWVKADADNYAQNKEKFEKLWTQIATRFASYNQRLLFEGYNEMLDANSSWTAPADGSECYTALNNYAQSFVNAVRATGGNNATRNLIINAYAGKNEELAIKNLTMPTDKTEGHLIFEAHSYDPWDWFATKGAWDSECQKYVTDMFARLKTYFIDKGYPVIIGEYGTHGSKSVSSSSSSSQIQAAADQAAQMVKEAKAVGAATFYWSSIYEGSDRTVPQWSLSTVVEAMKKAYNE